MTGNFNPVLARQLAQASADAYERCSIAGTKTDTQVLIWQGNVWQGNEDSGSPAKHSPANSVTIAFRGSSNLRDWITNSKFVMREESGLRVHDGFADALDEIFPRLEYQLSLLASSRPNIYLTGHSLGGALAMLAAWRLWDLSYPITAVYTFGQPRVGGAEFADSFNINLGKITWRVVNDRDLVTRLPGVLTGYRHAGNEAFINSAGKLILNPSLVRKLKSDFISHQTWLHELLTDHRMEHYLEKLNAP